MEVEPAQAAVLLSRYALVQSVNVIPLSPRTKHFLKGLRRQRYWESFPQAVTLLLSGTRPEGADIGLGQPARRGASTSKEDSAR